MRSIAREASVAPATTFKREARPKNNEAVDLDAAKKIEAAYRTKLALGEVGINDKKEQRWKVGELLDRRLADLKERGKGDAKTVNLNKHVKEDFGSKWADELVGDDLNNYFRLRRAEGYAVATITNRIAEVISAYRHAGLTAPKLRQLSRAEKDNVRTGFFSATEFDAVCERLPEDLQAFARFGHLTGWRFGSIVKLRWCDIDDGEINLPGQFTKNGSPLKMPLVGVLANLIASRKETKVVRTATGVQISNLVFHRHGKPIRQSIFRSIWVDACIRAGQGRIVCTKCGQQGLKLHQKCSHCRASMKYEGRLFHDLRRSAARDMIRAGVAQTIAMKITGHKTATMFERYNIADTDDLREALAKTALYREAGREKVRAISGRAVTTNLTTTDSGNRATG